MQVVYKYTYIYIIYIYMYIHILVSDVQYLISLKALPHYLSRFVNSYILSLELQALDTSTRQRFDEQKMFMPRDGQKMFIP